MPSKPFGPSRSRNRTPTSADPSRSGSASSRHPASESSPLSFPLWIGLALLTSLTVGCDRTPSVRVTLAEFQDETPDGAVQQDETIRILLDRPLPENHDSSLIRIAGDDLGSADLAIELSEDRRRIDVTIRTGRPDFRFEGVFGADESASGLRVDLGDGIEQSIDLQIHQPIPRLVAATWVDTEPVNGIVDRGDRLRLRFDERVKLGPNAEGQPVRVPGELRLGEERPNQLDDGSEPSRWRAVAESGHGVDVELGSRPSLSLATASEESTDERGGDASTLLLNGTRVRPLPTIRSAGGGRGVSSDREVAVQLPPELSQRLRRFSQKRRWLLEEEGVRTFHRLTPFRKYAMVTGGLNPTEKSESALPDVFLLTTRLSGDDDLDVADPYVLPDLPRPTVFHTATLLAGEDREIGTPDDFVVIAGGTDNGQRTLADISVVYLEETSGMQVKWLAAKLRIPRAEHEAIAVSHNQILLDGGRSSGRIQGHVGLVEAAELLTIRRSGDQFIVESHETIRTIARKRHSLTLIHDSSGEPWVLAYGGFGRTVTSNGAQKNRPRSPAVPEFGGPVDPDSPASYFPEEDAAVLYCPSLLRVRKLDDSIEKLPIRLETAFLRHGHRALALEQGGEEKAPPRVVIFGGTLVHPTRGTDGPVSRVWEISPGQFFHDLERERPRIDDTLDGLRFELDEENPRESKISIVEHSAHQPETLFPRENFSMTEVPGFGVVIAGGETTRDDGTSSLLSSVEVYFTEGERAGELRQMAWPLATPRSAHVAYLVGDEKRRFLLLVGGRTPSTERTGTDVDVFPLP